MARDLRERLRGRAGKAQRLRRLQRTHGLCEMCLASGRVEPATVVDHVVPLARGGLDFDENTRNLCDPHHAEVTAEQFGFAVAPGGRGVDRQGRPTGSRHAWSGRPRPTPADPAAPRRRPRPPGGG